MLTWVWGYWTGGRRNPGLTMRDTAAQSTRLSVFSCPGAWGVLSLARLALAALARCSALSPAGAAGTGMLRPGLGARLVGHLSGNAGESVLEPS